MNWKMIYLARRNPALSPAQFPQAWREHSALGRQCRNVGERVRSVTQCSRRLDVTLPGLATDYDGVNLLGLADREAAHAIWTDPETLAIMKPDELRVFDRYVREFTLVCQEILRRDGPRTSVVLHGFLRRRAGLEAPAFESAWTDADPAAALQAGPFDLACRIVENVVVDPPPPGYAYDRIVEWWYESEDALRLALGGQNPQDPRQALSGALARLLDLPGSAFLLTQVTHSRP